MTLSTPRSVILWLPLAASLSSCIGFGIGRAGADLELETPKLEVELSLDQDVYGTGAPVIAQLTLLNTGELPVTVARPSHFTVEFYLRPHASPDPIHTQMVTWPLETASYVPLEPGARHQRSHVLSRATLKPGDYDVFAIYRSEPEADIELAATVASNAVPIKVTTDVAMERDSMGLIVKDEAARIARAHFHQPESRIDCRLVMDKNVRMHQWWVTVYFSEPTAAGDSLGSCFIDPYLGRVRGETNVPVEVDTTPQSVIEQGGNTGAGG